jgi:hypothetical protein
MRTFLRLPSPGLILGLVMAARGADPAPAALTFDLLQKTVLKDGSPPRFPKPLTDLDGKKVRVTGHVCPYDQHMLRLMKFILTPDDNPGCFFCNPPDENAVVFVRLPAGAVPMTWKSAIVTVEGILHLKGHSKDDKEAAQFLATVDQAVVTARK